MGDIHKRIKIIIFQLLLLGTTALWGQELTLPDAVRVAFAHNRDILAQEQEILKARAQVLGTWNDFLPRLNLLGSYTYRDGLLPLASFIPPSISTPKDIGVFTGYQNEKKAALAADWSLFNSGRGLANRRQAKYNLQIQEETLRARKLAIEFEVRRLYYGLQLAKETERIAGQLVDQARAHLDEVDKKYKEGTVAHFDVLQSKLQVSKALPQLVKAQNARELIKTELKKTLGMNLDTELELKDAFVFAHQDLDENSFREYALAHRPDFAVRALSLAASQENITVAKATGRPQITANANYSYTSGQVNDMFNDRHNIWNAGVTLGIPIFDGFAAKSRVDEAKARYAQLGLQKDDLNLQVDLEIRQSCEDLRNSESIIETQRDSIDIAKEALQIAEASYRVGEGTNLDILDAQVTLSQIDNNLYEAIYEYNIATAALNKAIGRSEIEEAKSEK